MEACKAGWRIIRLSLSVCVMMVASLLKIVAVSLAPKEYKEDVKNSV